jgi:hypothetical protein
MSGGTVMKGVIIGVMGAWIGVVGLTWAEAGTPTPPRDRDRVMAMAALRTIVMHGWPCEKAEVATHVESRGGEEAFRVSYDGQQHVYLLVILASGEMRVERW